MEIKDISICKTKHGNTGSLKNNVICRETDFCIDHERELWMPKTNEILFSSAKFALQFEDIVYGKCVLDKK